ncbi:MAG TPA: tetratricopeptide repeat protein, partial [Gemmataceae bacterium]|nr:tetratricopeptide repeat protein [Gemmataceae bacterium]
LVGAIQHYRTAIALDPKDAKPHYNLGVALEKSGDVAGAIQHYRTAVAIDPKLALAHTNLGVALQDSKDVAGAIQHYRTAVAIDPKDAKAHTNLGNALAESKDVAGAIKHYRTAIALDPKDAKAHGALGQVLLEHGQFAEARDATRQALSLLSPGHLLQKLAQQQLRRCDQLLALEGKLNAYLDKGDTPTQPQELLPLIDLCRVYKQYHATAAKLHALAFAAQPALAETLNQGHRYQAARSAALAAAGQGRDPGKLTAEEKTELRVQALTWLQADLLQWNNRLQARDLKALPGLLTRLPAWQQETALAALRDLKERARLPADEQQDWAKLWADVDQLMKQVAANVRTEHFTGTLTAKDKARTHEVTLQAGQTYIIDLESPQFNTYLRLHDTGGKLLAENDDIAPGVNTNSLLLFTAPADGSYRLVATSFQQRGTGSYTLTVRSFVPANKE